MLRTLILVLALGAPGLAAAEQFPESALHADIRSDTGEVVGRVEAVERDAEGRVVAIESEALEPADAPAASRDLVAERRDDQRVTVSENLRREGGANGASRAR